MFIPNSPRPPSGITCSFRSDIVIEQMLDVKFIQHQTSLYLLVGVDSQRSGCWKSSRDGGCGSVAGGMAEAAGADKLAGTAIGGNVVDHVVAAHGAAHSRGHVTHIQHASHLPGDDVIGAGGIAAHAH